MSHVTLVHASHTDESPHITRHLWVMSHLYMHHTCTCLSLHAAHVYIRLMPQVSMSHVTLTHASHLWITTNQVYLYQECVEFVTHYRVEFVTHYWTCITLTNHDESQGIPGSCHAYTCITHMTERHVTRIHASYHTYTCITLMTNCHSIYTQSDRYRALATILCRVRDYLPDPMDHAKILKAWSPRYSPLELYFCMIRRVGRIVTNSAHCSP